MSIQVEPATLSDALALAEVESLAFGPDPSSQIMFGPADPSALPHRAADLQKIMTKDPAAHFFKAVYVEEGQAPVVAGVAQWTFRTNPNWAVDKNPEIEGSLAGVDLPQTWPPGANEGACKEFFGWIFEVRKRRMAGRGHALLSLLATRPDYQGRGAGSALVKHGLEMADKENLPAWLEASKMGYPVYKKHGFKDVEEHATDFTPFSSIGEYKTTLVGMEREPAGGA